MPIRGADCCTPFLRCCSDRPSQPGCRMTVDQQRSRLFDPCRRRLPSGHILSIPLCLLPKTLIFIPTSGRLLDEPFLSGQGLEGDVVMGIAVLIGGWDVYFARAGMRIDETWPSNPLARNGVASRATPYPRTHINPGRTSTLWTARHLRPPRILCSIVDVSYRSKVPASWTAINLQAPALA